jgi:hypothetical protein
MTFRRQAASLLAVAFFLAAASAAHARLQVDIEFKRTLYIAYEPLIVNVSITNLSGNALNLADSGRTHWFGFLIETLDGRPIPPRSSSHTNPPILLEPGQKITRAVNLAPLYPLAEYGGYRVRASVNAQPFGTFTSPPLNIEITEGRKIWSKSVGVPADEPGGGGTREITLLTHRFPSSSQLYIRIVDPEKRSVLCTHRLGRIVSYGMPDVQLDTRNRIHILQNLAPKTFLYSLVGLDGEVLERKTYTQRDKRPALVLAPDGTASVLGAVETRLDEKMQPAAAPDAPPVPSLSGRPVQLPTGKPKPTPEEARPKNLLSE